jgi:hypothetical protein
VEQSAIKRQAILSANDIINYSIEHGEQRIDLRYFILKVNPIKTAY